MIINKQLTSKEFVKLQREVFDLSTNRFLEFIFYTSDDDSLAFRLEYCQSQKKWTLEPEHKIKNNSIKSLGLSIATQDRLENANFWQISDLVSYIEKNGAMKLLKIKSFGRRSLGEVLEKLEKCGFLSQNTKH